ncbi:MAG: DUF6353 family protein [Erysipelotrichia bacterium]|nr:DUF6353 family protein [Erysipelotrichia bacterium]
MKNKLELIKNGFFTLCKLAKKNAPTILTVVSVIGVGVTVYETAKVTPKVTEVLEENKDSKPIEKVVKVLPAAAPAVVATTATCASIILANVSAAKRIKELSAACALVVSSLNNWKETVKETVNQETFDELKSKVVEKDLKPTLDLTCVDRCGYKGTTLCYDKWSGRYFYSDPEFIKLKFAEFKYKLANNDSMSLNQLYSDLGLEPNEFGESFGWDITMGQKLTLDITSKVCRTNDQPCLVLDYDVWPLDFPY